MSEGERNSRVGSGEEAGVGSEGHRENFGRWEASAELDEEEHELTYIVKNRSGYVSREQGQGDQEGGCCNNPGKQ